MVDVDGELTMAGVALDHGLKLSDVQIALTLQDGKLDITRMQSSAFGGTLHGRFSLDAAHPGSPKVAMKLDGQNLDLASILASAGTPRPVRGGDGNPRPSRPIPANSTKQAIGPARLSQGPRSMASGVRREAESG